MNYEPHPASLILPPMTADEFAGLCDDIAARGLLEPIDRLDGQILDGNNRYRACATVGVTPRFVDWAGDDPIAYVLSKNVQRRHLTPSLKAAAAVEAEALYAEAAKARKAQASGQPRGTKSLGATLPQESSFRPDGSRACRACARDRGRRDYVPRRVA